MIGCQACLAFLLATLPQAHDPAVGEFKAMYTAIQTLKGKD